MKTIPKLITFLKSKGSSVTAGCPVVARYADRVPCNHAVLYMIAKGHKRPSPAMARKIEAATRGGVTRYDLRADVFGKAP